MFRFVTFPRVVYQHHSSMTASVACVTGVDSWLTSVCRVGRLVLPLLHLYSFMRRYILFSSSAFTTGLQCPRSPAAASHVVVSIPATFISRLQVSLYTVADIWMASVRVPVTSSPYNMYFGMRLLGIRWTWPNHRQRR